MNSHRGEMLPDFFLFFERAMRPWTAALPTHGSRRDADDVALFWGTLVTAALRKNKSVSVCNASPKWAQGKARLRLLTLPENWAAVVLAFSFWGG